MTAINHDPSEAVIGPLSTLDVNLLVKVQIALPGDPLIHALIGDE